jgi:hypothetical protein
MKYLRVLVFGLASIICSNQAHSTEGHYELFIDLINDEYSREVPESRSVATFELSQQQYKAVVFTFESHNQGNSFKQILAVFSCRSSVNQNKCWLVDMKQITNTGKESVQAISIEDTKISISLAKVHSKRETRNLSYSLENWQIVER